MQRQLRLGDILDDYCPRERRVTNHAVVAMVGSDVKRTRCTTCDAEHEYKQAKIPRQRRKAESPAALYAQVAAGAPKRVAHEPDGQPSSTPDLEAGEQAVPNAPAQEAVAEPSPLAAAGGSGTEPDDERENAEEGPVHRPLIRASLPRPEGQPPPTRPIPEFTIRQPGGRPNRFRTRHQRGGGGLPFHGNRSNGNAGGFRGGGASRPPRRHGQGGGRKRSK
jgi:hypothetical protein